MGFFVKVSIPMPVGKAGKGQSTIDHPKMSHEFQVHHLLNELVSLLHVKGADVDIDSYADLLLKNRTPYVTTQVSAHTAKRKLAEFSSCGDKFLAKYDELRQRQTRDLNPLVFLLSKITEDTQLCAFLREARPPTTDHTPKEITDVKILDLVEGQEVALPEKGAKLTQEELGDLLGKLASVTTTLQERQKAKKSPEVTFNLPKLPEWLSNRPYLTRDFVIQPPLTISPAKGGVSGGVALGSMPVAMQEQAILEDLLSTMMGQDGRYIHANPLKSTDSERIFTVDKTLDVSLHALLDRVLPICGHYSTTSRFIEEKNKYVHGVVNQALCSAMRNLLKEYSIIVAQLEHQFRINHLTLQKLWFYVQPCKTTLEILSHIAVSIAKGSCRGGKTLTNLHNFTSGYIGDSRCQELCLSLTQAACKPYFDMLEKWIYTGVVCDPYMEFMVQEHEMIQKDRLHEEYNDSYWERHYTIAQENTPSFLEYLAEKILSTGKYLNVIRECGREVSYPKAKTIQYSVQERSYVERIEKAHVYASKQLLELMIKDQDLFGYLHSIKHYFLLDQGDLLVHFMDMAQDELYKPMSEILSQRLQSLLELAIRTSLADHDPYKDNVQPHLVPFDLVTQLLYIVAIQPEGVGPDVTPPPPILRPSSETSLSGLEAFCLDYHVKWPLSLVISRKCLFKYQMLFRHLFYCKHVERQLGVSWSLYKRRKDSLLTSHLWFGCALALLQRMLNFVQNLQYYMMFEVLEPNWIELEQKLRTASTIDDVLARHNDFLDKCLRDCLLSSRDILENMSRLMTICTTFTGHMQLVSMESRGATVSLSDRPPVIKSKLVLTSVGDMMEGATSKEAIERFDENFTKELKSLLDKLHSLQTDKVGGIVARLDFNGFYQRKLSS